MSDLNDLPLLKLSPRDFGRALPAVNRTKRFIVFVPPLIHGGEALVFPKNTRRASQPIKQGRGVVFYNGVDQAWQAAQGNGEDAIVINDITAEQADALLTKQTLLRGQNAALNLDAIKKLLAFAKDELGIIDFYNKRASSIARDTRIIDAGNPFFMEVSKPTIHHALYVPQAFTFDGPVQQVYPAGAVMVSDGRRCWGVGTEVFMRGYKKIQQGKEQPLTSVQVDFEQQSFVKTM
ncbi:MAG: hypothetical protein VXW65_14990 [Pseudomonadota bacterium]|nr:hypothetical protein [Pseudomonadota bacterium]